MRCRWCGGTGDRCQDGDGCEHCNSTGVQVDPPFGQLPYLHDVLSRNVYDQVMDVLGQMPKTGSLRSYAAGSPEWVDIKADLVRTINQALSDIRLPDDDVMMFARYWGDATCGDNYGTMINRIAMRLFEYI